MKKKIYLIALTLFILLLGVGIASYLIYKPKSSSAPKCNNDTCFQEKFAKCEPASLQQETLLNSGAKAYYEILGGDTAKCKMLYRTDADNLDLICVYQDTDASSIGGDYEFVRAAGKNEYDVALGEETSCSGPKVEKLKQVHPSRNTESS